MLGIAMLALGALTTTNTASEPSGADWHVHIVVQVSSTGAATGCRVIDSNAPQEMQAKTCQILQEKGRFTPKRDADGYAMASEYETTVRYQIPDARPHPVADTTAQSDPLVAAFRVGDWSGACRKADAGDTLFTECDAQASQADMTVRLHRTYAGMEIAVGSPRCGTSGPVGRATVKRSLLTDPMFAAAAVSGSIAGAVAAGQAQCPALPQTLYARGEIKDLIAATGNLRKAP